MPRKSRIESPGVLHHVIARCIAKSKIFLDEKDQKNFLKGLGTILNDTQTACYARALMPNHFICF